MTCFPKKGLSGEKSQGTLDPRSVSPSSGLSPYEQKESYAVQYLPCKPQSLRGPDIVLAAVLIRVALLFYLSYRIGFHNPEMHARKEHLALRPEGRAGGSRASVTHAPHHYCNVTNKEHKACHQESPGRADQKAVRVSLIRDGQRNSVYLLVRPEG